MATPACAARSRFLLRARVTMLRDASATIAADAACTSRVVARAPRVVVKSARRSRSTFTNDDNDDACALIFCQVVSSLTYFQNQIRVITSCRAHTGSYDDVAGCVSSPYGGGRVPRGGAGGDLRGGEGRGGRARRVHRRARKKRRSCRLPKSHADRPPLPGAAAAPRSAPRGLDHAPRRRAARGGAQRRRRGHGPRAAHREGAERARDRAGCQDGSQVFPARSSRSGGGGRAAGSIARRGGVRDDAGGEG